MTSREASSIVILGVAPGQTFLRELERSLTQAKNLADERRERDGGDGHDVAGSTAERTAARGWCRN